MAIGSPLNWANALLQVDSRGNRLHKAHVTRTKDSSDFFLDLNCCDDIAKQFVWALRDRHPVELDARGEWTHKVRFDGPYERWLQDLIDLLERVLTLRTGPEISTAIALDFHSAPPDPEDASGEWTRTEVGDLVYRKYFKDNPGQVSAAGSCLSDLLVSVINSHPQYGAADSVILVPGTSHTFGERLARTVASRADLPLIRAVCLATDHSPAKEGHASDELEPYRIEGDVLGQRVIIVDDVFKSGLTMRAVAAAALAGGSSDVLGLVATRTMRRV